LVSHPKGGTFIEVVWERSAEENIWSYRDGEKYVMGSFIIASYPMGTRDSFLGGGGWCEADHTPPSSAEVNNAWSYTFTPPMRFHGVIFS
jgi:hypothetical protein